MEAERKAITVDLAEIHLHRTQAWANAQTTWDSSDNQWRVAIATAEAALTAE
jgi:hypothetical protein